MADGNGDRKRLFLLDGMALIYRAHFALIRAPIFTSGRVNTSAIFGFANTLLDLLEKQKPTHLAVAFDTPTATVVAKFEPCASAIVFGFVAVGMGWRLRHKLSRAG